MTGRLLLLLRLAVRDVRHRRVEGLLVVLVLATATATLTVGRSLDGTTDDPYEATRKATSGPDVVAQLVPPPPDIDQPSDIAAFNALTRADGVVAYSGPFAMTKGTLDVNGHHTQMIAQGRMADTADVDQPHVTEGTWVSDGGVVIERGFADALGADVGEPIALDGHSFRIVGTAVTAALPIFPSTVRVGWNLRLGANGERPNPGLVWLTQSDLDMIHPAAADRASFLSLRLANRSDAAAFVARHTVSRAPDQSKPWAPILSSWTEIRDDDNATIQGQQEVLNVGSWLLALLSTASIAVMTGGRMAAQRRRVGLLKAVGGTPGLIGAVLFVQHVALAMAGSIVGLIVGRLAAPLFVPAESGLLGSSGSPSIDSRTVLLALLMSLTVAGISTAVPGVRAARTSTVESLTDSARPPRRVAWLIATSSRLPVALLISLRIVARRPRRGLLNAFTVLITVVGLVVVLAGHASITQAKGSVSTIANPRYDRLNDVMLGIALLLIVLTVVNVVFLTWTTVQDARRSSALTRALGATPGQVATGLGAAQVLPALLGVVVGIPAGIVLNKILTEGDAMLPPMLGLVLLLAVTPFTVAAVTAWPVWRGAQQPVAESLQAEVI